MTTNTNPYASHKVPTSGGDMLKPVDNRQYTLRIVGEAIVYQSTYEDKLSTSYVMAVWNFTDSQANIWRLPAGSFQQIVDLANSDWGDPTSYNLLYKRTGSGTDTRHSIQVSPSKGALTTDQQATVEALDVKAIISRFPSVSHVFTLSEANDGGYATSLQEDEPPITDDDIPPEFRS